MNAEELIERYATHTGNGECLFDYNLALFVIEDYAKQTAIAFDAWKRVNMYTLDYPNSRYIKLIVSGDKARTEMVPADDVYRQFIEQQIK